MDRPRYYFVGDRRTVELEFAQLGFDYMPCPYRFEAVYELGVWRVRGAIEDNEIHLPEGSQCLHYGQQLFEGMKVQTGADGKVYAFRPRENSKRMNEGARYLQGPEVPEALFLRGIEEVVQANYPYLPPYESGAALYVRPFYLGVGHNVGVKPARRYVFRIFVSPVGPYFKGGFGPDQGKAFMVSRFDRAAPRGTGHVKAGGNYACSFHPCAEARAAGYSEALYLDPVEHRYIEEIGAANFLALKGHTLLTPNSHSVLPSVTRRSLMKIAAELLDWPVEERQIDIDELAQVDAAACCGTAAVITWIREIVDPSNGRRWEFGFDPRWKTLYDMLTGIQTARIDDPFGWRYEIPVTP